jgi:predicted nucleic acid-binding protein
VIYLVDTNVLLRWTDADSPRHGECVAAINRLIEKGHQVSVCAQVLIEYWVTSTRPVEVNGFGLSLSVTNRNISEICRAFPCLPEPSDIAVRWHKVVVTHGVIGKQAHDARLVALMRAYTVSRILTLNPGDFTRYPKITPLTPSDILSM